MTTKKQTESKTIATTFAGISDGISSASLDPTTRQRLRGRNANVPDELIEMVCHLAQQGGGSVLGIPFDATTASATLSETSATQTSIAVGRQTLQRLEDDMLQQRATVADPAFAIYRSLQRLVKTKGGNSLLPAYEQMKLLVKNRPRKPRKKAAATQDVTPVATGASAAPVTAAAVQTAAKAVSGS